MAIKDVRKILHTIFFKVKYIVIQVILSRKSMKKVTITDEEIFRVYKAFDNIKTQSSRTASGEKLSVWSGRLQK